MSLAFGHRRLEVVVVDLGCELRERRDPLGAGDDRAPAVVGALVREDPQLGDLLAERLEVLAGAAADEQLVGLPAVGDDAVEALGGEEPHVVRGRWPAPDLTRQLGSSPYGV